MKAKRGSREALLARLRDKGLGLAPVVSKPSTKLPAARALAAAPVADLSPEGPITHAGGSDRSTGHTAPGEFTLWVAAPADFLNLNHRQHWAPKADLTKAWRKAAARAARDQLMPKRWGRVAIECHVVKATARKYDAHNLLPTGKAIVDGLVDYQVVIDDSNEFVTGPDMRPGGSGEPGIFVVVSSLASSS